MCSHSVEVQGPPPAAPRRSGGPFKMLNLILNWMSVDTLPALINTTTPTRTFTHVLYFSIILWCRLEPHVKLFFSEFFSLKPQNAFPLIFVSDF